MDVCILGILNIFFINNEWRVKMKKLIMAFTFSLLVTSSAFTEDLSGLINLISSYPIITAVLIITHICLTAAVCKMKGGAWGCLYFFLAPLAILLLLLKKGSNIGGIKSNKNDIYDYSENERYSLGIKGEKPLICIGINPSTASPNNYDNTMKKLVRIVNNSKKNYDSWIMLNIYPQRATDTNDLDEELNTIIHNKNLKIIEKYANNNSKILCSWGTLLIDKERLYLQECLIEIYDLLNKKQNIKYYHIDRLTRDGHPKHILFANLGNGLIDFDMKDYINTKIKKQAE
jgi:hypothetical protein